MNVCFLQRMGWGNGNTFVSSKPTAIYQKSRKNNTMANKLTILMLPVILAKASRRHLQ